MNIVRYLPEIFAAVVIALILGLVARLLLEGASVKNAFISTCRIIFLPLAVVAVVNAIYTQRRKIIFDLKSSSKDDEQFNKKIEYALESRTKLFLFIASIAMKVPRAIVDVYIKASVKYEQKQDFKTKSRRKKDKQERFYDYFLDDIDVKGHLFHH